MKFRQSTHLKVIVTVLFFAQLFAFGFEILDPMRTDPIEVKNRFEGPDEHVVFLVHGLAGDRRTFGGLNRLLKDRYGDRVVVRHLTYDTVEKADDVTDESGALTVDIFKQQVFVKLVSFLQDREKRGLITHEAPSFSIISHSQGGLVVRDLLKDCLYPGETREESPCSYKEALKLGSLADDRADRNVFLYQDVDEKEAYGRNLAHFRNGKHWFIYGTPFGGSPQASKLFGGILAVFKRALDSEESRDLKNGSEPLVADRDDLVDLAIARQNGKRLNDTFPSGMEIYSFSGDIAEIDGQGKSFAFARALLASGVETDVVVPVSSSRLDMIYFKEDPKNSSWKAATKGVTRFANGFFPVKLPHLSLGSVSGLISAENIENGPEAESYEHVGVDLLVEILDVFFKDQEKPDFGKTTIRDEYVKSLDNFSVEMKIVPPEGYDRLPDLTDGAVRPSAPEASPIDVPVLKDGLFYKASGINKEMRDTNRTNTSFYHWGRFSEDHAIEAVKWLEKNKTWRPDADFADNPEQYPYRMKYLILERSGWQARTVVLPVAPTYLTFAEIFLQPFLPIKPIGTKLETPIGISGNLDYDDGRVLERSELLKDQFPEGAHVVGLYELEENSVRLFLTSSDPKVRNLKVIDVSRSELYREIGSENSGHLQAIVSRRTGSRRADRKIQCSVAHFADRQGRHFNALYPNLESDEVLALMDRGDSVEIIGRVAKKDENGRDLDLYLLTSSKIRALMIEKGMANTPEFPFLFASRFDLDVDKGHDCDFNWLPK